MCNHNIIKNFNQMSSLNVLSFSPNNLINEALFLPFYRYGDGSLFRESSGSVWVYTSRRNRARTWTQLTLTCPLQDAASFPQRWKKQKRNQKRRAAKERQKGTGKHTAKSLWTAGPWKDCPMLAFSFWFHLPGSWYKTSSSKWSCFTLKLVSLFIF